jgi:hypothetical protein
MHNNQMLVDWFRFWLKDEEDDDPEKIEQYVRWREFKMQQENHGSGKENPRLSNNRTTDTKETERKIETKK